MNNNFSFAWQYVSDGDIEVAHTKDPYTAWWLFTQLYDVHKLTINFYPDQALHSNVVRFSCGVETHRRFGLK